MPIRVHELAKEFKISTAALKKHLKDMGVEVKSHMSPVEDEIASKIRGKFKQEAESIKQRQMDRNKIHKKIILSHKNQPENAQPTSQPKADSNQRKEQNSSREEIPVFVEKKIKKAPPSHTQSRDTRNTQRRDDRQGRPDRQSRPDRQNSQSRPDRQGRPTGGASSTFKKPYNKPTTTGRKPYVKKEVKPPIDSPTGKDLPKFKDDKIKAKDKKAFEDKQKHIKAKVKHLKKKKGGKRFEPTELDEATISKNIKKTLSKVSKKKKYKKEDKTSEPSSSKIVISEFTSVSELAKLMNISATEIIGSFFKMGQMVTINQRLDKESLEMICMEFDFNVEFQEEYGTDILEEQVEEIADEEKVSRPPVVTIMGHVDHGKTAILDYIREANVVAGESGGITQHIGAYQIVKKGKPITFIDTPGHEAFTAMRARGANVTDIAIIVVSAAEGVKKQTIEAIDHAKAAGVQIIVAMNKIDLKDANIDRVVGEVMSQNLLLEGYGGDVLWVPCSAKTGEGIDELLETIILASDIMELKAAESIPAKGIVIESQKDPRMGTIATILLQDGILEKGDNIICGATYGRIRKMEDERGNEIETLKPSGVARLFGINDVPKAGDILNTVESDKVARSISAERTHIRKEREKYQTKTNLDNLFQRIKEDKMNEIKLIVKADTDGSVEALCDSFQKLSTDEIMVNVIRRGVGGINEADVSLASASDGIIIGFHVRANNSAKKLAEDENVEIKLYQIIYEAIEDLQSAMLGMLEPEDVEVYRGTALVKQAFRIKKVGVIAGCYVEKGTMTNEGMVRVYRNDIMIHEGKLASLKHYANEVKEVKSGSECGIGIENYNDIKEGDHIENYVIQQVARKL